MQLTKAIILERIVKEGYFFKICLRITKNNSLCDDLFQECILILLEKTEAQIVELYSRNELQPYFIRIVQNSYNSKTSPFFKKYKLKIEFRSEIGSEEIESKYDYDKIVDHIRSGNYPRSEMFDNQIVNLLTIDNNIFKLARNIGIDRQAIRSAIKRFKKRINASDEFKRESI